MIPITNSRLLLGAFTITILSASLFLIVSHITVTIAVLLLVSVRIIGIMVLGLMSFVVAAPILLAGTVVVCALSGGRDPP